MRNPFRYFNSSPEVIRLAVMMYIRYPLSLRSTMSSLRELCSGQRVTFVFATKDTFHNGAVVLKEYIDAE